MITVNEMMASFEKQFWSHDKPLELAVDVVRSMLEEQLRVLTVFMECSSVILEAHPNKEERSERVKKLLLCLMGEEDSIFLNHLSPIQREEYNENLKNKVSFEDIQE